MDLTWLWVIPMLLLLVLVHEAGHFWAARCVGITVKEFAVGLPPRLLSRTRGGVRYSLGAVPLGGFVRLLGEDAAESGPGSYNAATPGQRALVLVAGVVANFLFAVLLMALVAVLHGRPMPADKVAVVGVTPGAPAATAGLLAGDLVIAVDGHPLADPAGLRERVLAARGGQVTLTVERDGTAMSLPVAVRAEAAPDEGLIGLRYARHYTYTPQPLWSALPAAVDDGVTGLGLMVAGLGGLVGALLTSTGGPAPVTGPIGVGQLVGELAARSPLPLWVTLINMTALISLNLALMNLLPLPALDGGRLVLVGLEVLRGRPLPPSLEGRVHWFGLVFLLGLMVVVAAVDLMRLGSGRPLLP